MTPLDDWELLRRYARQRDEAAFEQVVRRHVNLVFSSALRRVGDRHMAEDVTQGVFVILAKKAGSICDGRGALSAWLLRCVRYAAGNAIKMERRRRKHEAACPPQWTGANGAGACSGNPTDVLVWQEVAYQLDDAVLKLPAVDRQAVLLRYFEDRAISEIAAELNVSEGAAKQRLSRALEKLRERLRRSGALLGSIDGMTLAALLASHAVKSAPPGLVSAACAAATGGAVTGAGIGIAKGAMTMMTWAKAKVAAAAVIGVMVIGGAGGIVAVKAAGAEEKKPADAAKAQADDPAEKPNSVSVQMAPPVVVKTVPVAGSRTVDPATTEIRVTFSKEMQDKSWSWSTWGEENFPKLTGKPKYLDDKRTCVAPVELKPGRTYAIWLNSENFGNFKDSEGKSAVPYLLVFETRK